MERRSWASTPSTVYDLRSKAADKTFRYEFLAHLQRIAGREGTPESRTDAVPVLKAACPGWRASGARHGSGKVVGVSVRCQNLSVEIRQAEPRPQGAVVIALLEPVGCPPPRHPRSHRGGSGGSPRESTEWGWMNPVESGGHGMGVPGGWGSGRMCRRRFGMSLTSRVSQWLSSRRPRPDGNRSLRSRLSMGSMPSTTFVSRTR